MVDMLDHYVGMGKDVCVILVYQFDPGVDGIVLCWLFGVVGVIVLWNFLMMLFLNKFGLVLLIGNIVVVKFVDMMLFMMFVLVEILIEVGFLFGVFNVVIGIGLVVGEVLVMHLFVRKVVFIGLMLIGECVMVLASCGIKCVMFEFGGSDLLIVCDDVDFVAVAFVASMGCFFNCG